MKKKYLKPIFNALFFATDCLSDSPAKLIDKLPGEDEGFWD